MQINKDTYQVLLPQKFWEESKSKAELKKKIEKYFYICYPNYSIEKIEKIEEAYIAICKKED